MLTVLQIAQLIEEGQKLQAQLMKSAERNKKIQEKSKEADAAAVQLNSRIAKYEERIKRLVSSSFSYKAQWLRQARRGAGDEASQRKDAPPKRSRGDIHR